MCDIGYDDLYDVQILNSHRSVEYIIRFMLTYIFFKYFCWELELRSKSFMKLYQLIENVIHVIFYFYKVIFFKFLKRIKNGRKSTKPRCKY